MIPTKEDIEKFKAELNQMSAEEIGQKLRHHIYGAKDNWKYKEEYFVGQMSHNLISI